MRAPVVGRGPRILAVLALGPPVIASVIFVPYELIRALMGLPTDIVEGIEGIGLMLVFYALPIIGAIWVGQKTGILQDRALKRRRKRKPFLPSDVRVIRFEPDLGPQDVGLPLFNRPLANLWTNVAVLDLDGVELRLFDFVHADLLGEGHPISWRSPKQLVEGILPGGMAILTCAAARVDADMPLIVVRPRRSMPIALPDGVRERTTELESFNRTFHLMSVDRYAATAIVDARVIDAVGQFDSRFAVEIGGRWILVYAQKLDGRGTTRLVQEAAALARVFPRVVTSLYPAGTGTATKPITTEILRNIPGGQE